MAAIKLINYGQSGHGKTGALASLCAAGYKVRVLDLENGIETLVNLLIDPASKYPKNAIDNLRWITLTEKMRVLNGNFVPMGSTVWPKITEMLGSKWKGDRRFDRAKGEIVETTPEEALPNMYQWGEGEVLAIDTLSSASERALEHNLAMQGQLGLNRTSNEGRRDMGSAQGKIDKFLQFLRDDNLKCNVVLNTHIKWAKEDGRALTQEESAMQNPPPLFAWPQAIGNALNTSLGKHFNHCLMTRKVGLEYEIRTSGVPGASLKSGAPLRVKPRYALANGLAEYFNDVNKVGGQSS